MAVVILGRPPVWCVGASFDPTEEHAWLEAEGVPIEEPCMRGIPYGAHVRI